MTERDSRYGEQNGGPERRICDRGVQGIAERVVRDSAYLDFRKTDGDDTKFAIAKLLHERANYIQEDVNCFIEMNVGRGSVRDLISLAIGGSDELPEDPEELKQTLIDLVDYAVALKKEQK